MNAPPELAAVVRVVMDRLPAHDRRALGGLRFEYLTAADFAALGKPWSKGDAGYGRIRLRYDLVQTLGYKAAASIVAHELAHERLNHAGVLAVADTPERRARCEAEADALAARWLGPWAADELARHRR